MNVAARVKRNRQDVGEPSRENVHEISVWFYKARITKQCANIMKTSTTIAVIGTGSWGTALAIHLARNGYQVNLWGKFQDEVDAIISTKRNDRYLPGIAIPDNITACTDIVAALKDVRDILIVVPSHVFHSTLQLIKPYLHSNTRIAWATKGLDENDELLSKAVQEVCGDLPMAVLSGPTFALEVARAMPTAITAASNDKNFAQDLVQYFHNEKFRVYTSSDLIGVQVGGNIKNVLAIAVGIADGMGFGANARAALITRGLVELMRLGVALGGKQETFVGLAGLGDLVLTCTDNQSRNRRFGLAVGSGQDRVTAEKNIGQVVEGIFNAKSAYLLAKRMQIEMPITEQVYKILYENISAAEALKSLLNRTPKVES